MTFQQLCNEVTTFHRTFKTPLCPGPRPKLHSPCSDSFPVIAVTTFLAVTSGKSGRENGTALVFVAGRTAGARRNAFPLKHEN